MLSYFSVISYKTRDNDKSSSMVGRTRRQMLIRINMEIFTHLDRTAYNLVDLI